MKKKRSDDESAIPSETPADTGPDRNGSSSAHPDSNFQIVGIGASAGGPAAFEAFFSGMPADHAGPGMAFVLVQHMAPDHKSLLADSIRTHVRMQVFEVEDGMAVQPNCIYIIPPNHDMAFLDGRLHLMEPAAPNGHRLPIDFFFRSLAQDQHERAIGIVLSGIGSDGTMGVRAIKAEGGMVMAQVLTSTEFDGMPRSAIATGLVDYVLPPAGMPAKLIAYATHASSRRSSRAASKLAPRVENELKKIFTLLRAQTGHDFSQNKPNTIIRRIERRMALQQVETMDGYVKYLQQTPAEVESLFRDMLIGVTNFFRDPEAFRALEEQVIPGLFAGKAESDAIRVWAPGCSTGEEAYSIAILLYERMEALKQVFKVQVFATDIDSQSIASARSGIYPASIAADISPERLARFFAAEHDGGSFCVHKDIRDMLIFSEQDVIRDPPFSKLDLISCRNLLIYMGSDLQKQLITLFHYALNPGRFLFLGASETVGELGDFFIALDRNRKLYQRKEDGSSGSRAPGRFMPPLMAMDVTPPVLAIRSVQLPAGQPSKDSVPRAAEGADGSGASTSLKTGSSDSQAGLGADARIAALEKEILTKDEYLQAANEELKAANEEMQSVNEELRSANEELETSEEELVTLNAELQQNVADLSRANNDINNLFAGTGIGTVFLDHQLRILRFTPSATEIINLIPSDIGRPVGHTVSNLVGYDRMVEDAQAVLDTLAPRELEVRTKAGVWYTMRILPYRTLSNVTEGAVINFVDITERKRMDEALRESESQKNAILNGISTNIALVDKELKILWANKAAAKSVNKQPEDMVGRPCYAFWGDKVKPCETCPSLKAFQTRQSEHKIVHTPDGRIWDEGGEPVFDNEGNVIAVVEIAQDITERKRAEKSLAASERQMRAIIDNAEEIIYTLSWTGEFLFVSSAWTHIIGHPVEEVVGRNFAPFVHPDDVDACKKFLRLVHDTGLPQRGVEYRTRTVNGEWRWFTSSGAVIRDDQGNPSYYVGVALDITEHKRGETELIQARDEAEKANRAKSQFMATMSHELRTPLNPILGFTELLAEAPNLTDEQKLWLRIVNQRGQDLLGLIKAVLDMAKIEAGKIVLDRKPIELRQTIQDIVVSVTPAAVKKNLRLEWEVAPEAPDIVLADGLRLRQVLLNLLNNALKFTDHGSIEVRVQDGRDARLARAPAKDETALLFSVKDTGIGIPASRQSAVFEAFEHADHEHAAKYGGAGLGLAIAKRLIDVMGGRIWVESPSIGSPSIATGPLRAGSGGRGSAFFFTILVGLRQATIQEPGPGVVLDPVPARMLRVLVVDDDEAGRMLAEEYVRNAGHVVLTAKDGHQAVTLFDQEAFDVVLMDVQMPGMDGLEATRIIRERDSRSGRHTLIIALTAYAMAGDKERFLAAGMDEYLAKPVSEAELIDAIRNVKV